MTEQALANINSQEIINQVKQLSGTTSGNYIPYIPIISINNQKEEKEIDIEGKLTKVEIPAKEGFNITLKDEKTNEYDMQYYGDKLEAVMLRVRYSIGSKNKVSPRYYSYEFDRFDDIIKVYDENKTVLIENNYANIKKRFATGEKNTIGKPKASFDLRVIIYVEIDNQIFRLRLNNASRSNFFDYMKTFGNDDIFQAYKTKFNLKFNDKGEIKFWYIEFEKGEGIDLTKEIPLLQELQKFFNVQKVIKQPEEISEQPTIYEERIIDVDSDIDVTQIPF